MKLVQKLAVFTSIFLLIIAESAAAQEQALETRRPISQSEETVLTEVYGVWTTERAIASSTDVRRLARAEILKNHVDVCVVAEQVGTICGYIADFTRILNIERSILEGIIITGKHPLEQHLLSELSTYPDIGTMMVCPGGLTISVNARLQKSEWGPKAGALNRGPLDSDPSVGLNRVCSEGYRYRLGLRDRADNNIRIEQNNSLRSRDSRVRERALASYDQCVSQVKPNPVAGIVALEEADRPTWMLTYEDFPVRDDRMTLLSTFGDLFGVMAEGGSDYFSASIGPTLFTNLGIEAARATGEAMLNELTTRGQLGIGMRAMSSGLAPVVCQGWGKCLTGYENQAGRCKNNPGGHSCGYACTNYPDMCGMSKEEAEAQWPEDEREPSWLAEDRKEQEERRQKEETTEPEEEGENDDENNQTGSGAELCLEGDYECEGKCSEAYRAITTMADICQAIDYRTASCLSLLDEEERCTPSHNIMPNPETGGGLACIEDIGVRAYADISGQNRECWVRDGPLGTGCNDRSDEPLAPRDLSIFNAEQCFGEVPIPPQCFAFRGPNFSASFDR